MTNPAQIFPRAGAHFAEEPLLAVACATPEEREMAADICRGRELRGLGQAARHPEWDASRWRNVDPCEVADLPTCPCVAEADVMPIGGCLAGMTPEDWPAELHDAWCAQTGAGLMQQPYCDGNPLPPVPDCLSPDEEQGLAYCNTHGYGGPNGILNALCWAAMSSGTLSEFNARPACPDEPPPDSGARTPTTAEPPPAEEPEEPPEPEEERASFAVPGLILLLVAAGGAAYYFAQRK